MSPKEKKEIIENLRMTLIKDWGDCLVDKDDWRYEQSKNRALSKKGSAHIHIVFVHNSSSNNKINTGLVKRYWNTE